MVLWIKTSLVKLNINSIHPGQIKNHRGFGLRHFFTSEAQRRRGAEFDLTLLFSLRLRDSAVSLLNKPQNRNCAWEIMGAGALSQTDKNRY